MTTPISHRSGVLRRNNSVRHAWRQSVAALGTAALLAALLATGGPAHAEQAGDTPQNPTLVTLETEPPVTVDPQPPVTPEQPVDPVDPVDPADPIGPGDPNQPADPSPGEEPQDTGEPADPGGRDEPATPAETSGSFAPFFVPQGSAAEGRGGIEGHVSVLGSSEPAAGVTVTWRPTLEVRPTIITLTDSNGDYRLPSVQSGSGTIDFAHPVSVPGGTGFAPAVANFLPSTPTAQTLPPTATLRVDGTVAAGAQVEGGIVDAEGRPYAKNSTSIVMATAGGPAATYALDADGHFRIRGLASGSYRLFVQVCDAANEGAPGECRWAQAGDVTLATGSTSTIDLPTTLIFTANSPA